MEPLLASVPHLLGPGATQKQLRRPLDSRYHQLMAFPASPMLPKEGGEMFLDQALSSALAASSFLFLMPGCCIFKNSKAHC